MLVHLVAVFMAHADNPLLLQLLSTAEMGWGGEGGGVCVVVQEGMMYDVRVK